MLSITDKLKRRKPERTKRVETVFTRDFIIGIVEINKKNAENFIRSQAFNYLQTEDFYFGYLYSDNRLHYVAHKSNKHIKGCASKLTPVLLNTGNYYIHANNNMFRFKNDGCAIESIVDYPEYSEDKEEQRLKVTNLDTVSLNAVPATLMLKWSLERKNLYFTAFMATIFTATLAIYYANSAQYEKLTQKAQTIRTQLEETTKNNNHSQLFDISQSIRELSDLIKNRGIIATAKGEKNTLIFAINMNENDARTFIKKTGGIYENGKIILSANLTHGK